MHRPRALVALVLASAACAASASTAVTARADDAAPAESAANMKEATRLFQRGSEQFRARRWVEALDSLRASYRLVPSPNSALLVARCLRELGRTVEAAETYAGVETEARRRASDDPSYAQTASAAATEGAQVRARLGTVRVRVAHTRPDARLEIDGAPTPLGDDGTAVVWHETGTARVRLVAPGVDDKRDVAVSAGGDRSVELDAEPPTASSSQPSSAAATGAPGATAGAAGGVAPGATSPGATSASRPALAEPPPEAAQPKRNSWMIPAAGLAAGIGIGGLAMFAGFGSSSHSTYEELRERCGPHACGDADRAEADAGMRRQRIANVGLAVGIVGVVVAVTLFVVHQREGR